MGETSSYGEGGLARSVGRYLSSCLHQYQQKSRLLVSSGFSFHGCVIVYVFFLVALLSSFIVPLRLNLSNRRTRRYMDRQTNSGIEKKKKKRC